MARVQICVLIVVLQFLPSLVVTSQSGGTDDPDYSRTISELIESRGFQFEIHNITTADSYILSVYRLINPLVDPEQRSKLKPVVLQHGLMGSAVDFIINAPGGDAVPCQPADGHTLSNLDQKITSNLAYLLANMCYDVWLSNSRGNRYSRNHTTLNPDEDAEYWNFSFDEMIYQDSPAIIDHILTTTGFDSLGWIGHSQGTLIMFGLLAAKPGYSVKVKPFIALAPVCYVNNIQFASLIRTVAHVPGTLETFRKIGGELSDSSAILNEIERIICEKVDPKICSDVIYPFMGYNVKLLNTSRISIYRAQGASSTSLWNLIQFAQNIAAGDFVRFDYGKKENMVKYLGPKPPKYPLTQINSTQIAFIYSKSDTLGDLKDVTQLKKTIKVPLLREYFVPLPSWNHADFLYATEAYRYVYTQVLDILKSTF